MFTPLSALYGTKCPYGRGGGGLSVVRGVFISSIIPRLQKPNKVKERESEKVVTLTPIMSANYGPLTTFELSLSAF